MSGSAGDTADTPSAELRLVRPDGSTRGVWLAGWREHVDLPRLGVAGMVAKLDTGARTSALHAQELERTTDARGRTWLRFELLAPEEDAGGDPPDPELGLAVEPAAEAAEPAGSGLVVPDGPVRARWVADRVIRSSNGVEELRPVIRTTIVLGGHRWVGEMTLAQRGSMGYPLLLGRTAIRRRFLVHPGRSFLADAPTILTEPRPERA